jgi:hypothetical protein
MFNQPLPQQPPKSLKGKGLALTAVVLGIIGICFSVIPIPWMIAASPAVVGLVFGLVAITEADVHGKGKGMAIAGTILSALALMLSALFWAPVWL